MHAAEERLAPRIRRLWFLACKCRELRPIPTVIVPFGNPSITRFPFGFSVGRRSRRKSGRPPLRRAPPFDTRSRRRDPGRRRSVRRGRSRAASSGPLRRLRSYSLFFWEVPFEGSGFGGDGGAVALSFPSSSLRVRKRVGRSPWR